MNRHKTIAKEKLNTEQGIEKRKQRCCDVGPVFGNIKRNYKFNRLMLRRERKVTIGIGLLALAQNLSRKKAASMPENRQKKNFLNKYALSEITNDNKKYY